MNENEALETMQESPEMPVEELTPEQLAEMEEAQRAEDEMTYGAVRNAAKQRKQSAAIIAEHDELLADMLYEITMNQFGEEV